MNLPRPTPTHTQTEDECVSVQWVSSAGSGSKHATQEERKEREGGRGSERRKEDRINQRTHPCSEVVSISGATTQYFAGVHALEHGSVLQHLRHHNQANFRPTDEGTG